MKRWDLLTECLLGILSIAALAAAVRADDLPPGAAAWLGTSALRHSHTVSALNFSVDGKLLVSASWDKTARVWELPSGREVSRFAGHKESASAAAISPDGLLAASGDMNHTTVLWDAKTGKELHRVEDNTNSVFWLRFSADGKRLVWASGKKVRIWDVAKWREERQIESEDGVRPVVLSPDGVTLAVGGDKGPIRIYRLDDGSLVKSLEGHSKMVFALAFNSNGSRLVSGGSDNTVRVWDVGSGQALHSVGLPDHWVRPVAFLNDGKSFATGVQDGTVRTYDTSTGKELASLQSTVRSDLWVMAMAVSNDGKTLATAGTEKAIRLWDAQTLAPIGPVGHGMELTSAAFIDGGKTIATASQDGMVGLWNAGDGKWIGHLGDVAKVGPHVAASADGKRLTVCTENPSLEIFDGVKKARTINVTDRLIAMHGLAMSGDGALLAVKLRHDTIRVIEAESGKERYAVKVNPRQFAEVPLAFSVDGRLMAFGTGDPDFKFVTLLDATSGQQIARLNAASGVNHSLAFSPDGLTLAAACRNTPIQLIEVASGSMRGAIEGDGDAGTCVAFSPDGRWIAAGGGPDKPTVRVWSLPSGKMVKKFIGHMGWVKQVVFSPDSKRLLSVSEDTTALLWDMTVLRAPANEAVDNAALVSAWADLVSENAPAAYAGMQKLAAAGEAGAAFVAARLGARVQTDSQQIKELIANLDADSYTKRQAAQGALQELAEAARPALREAMEKSPSDEIRSRATVLLKRLDAPGKATVESLRAMRGVEVLERAGAVKLLEGVAKEHAGTLAGERARGAVGRLKGAD